MSHSLGTKGAGDRTRFTAENTVGPAPKPRPSMAAAAAGNGNPSPAAAIRTCVAHCAS